MRGDFSRTTHRPNRHYSRVLLQQGRVLLDADWNEQVEIQLQTMRTMMADLVGPHGGPQAALGFEVTAQEHEGKLFVALAEPDSPGRYYVDGIMVEQHEVQPTKTELPFDFGTAVFVYLEVWEQQATWIEENMPFEQRSMRDIGLGGPDTCARSQLRWALRFIDARRYLEGNQGIALANGMVEFVRNPLRMRAGLTKQDIGAGDPCRDTAQPRYRGPENRLYRVEIHAVTQGEKNEKGEKASKGMVTFKWSRENGSVVFPVAHGEETIFRGDGELSLALGIPADPRFGLVEGNIVELVTSELDAAGEAGPLLQVTHIDESRRRVRLSVPKKSGDKDGERALDIPLGEWALLRRWDQVLDTRRESGSLATIVDGAIRIDLNERFMLEDGIYVQFGGEPQNPKPKDDQLKAAAAAAARRSAATLAALASNEAGVRNDVANFDAREDFLVPLQIRELPCRPGDYWLIPARTIPADIEWPSEAFEPPHGVERHQAPLAYVTFVEGSAASEGGPAPHIEDLRKEFTPLAQRVSQD